MGKRYRASDFIDAIPGSGGIISTIAKRVGCDWSTAKIAIDSTPTVKAAYDNECETVLDMAESVILKSIKDGDSGDAKWYLTRKGKDRGYVERQEMTGKDGGPIESEQKVKPDLSKLSVDELLALRQMMSKANNGTADPGGN